ncbi:DUF4019 domain-containing protein [Pseudomonas tohonis]|uniref:DUF4019 domain-containing protein n=1 Tax=Pseudomonas tohonis TaxID=2725477 RepID=UPI001F3B9690|nr:DUF4019 domain-containing protein [Pseudomonas tohonis]
MARSRISGTININILLAFIFGTIFLSVILGFVHVVPNPSEIQRWVFIIVVALAGAGIGAVIPGVLKIDIPHVKAGGALAIFVIILMNKPGIEKSAIDDRSGSFDSRPVVFEFLSRIAANDIDGAWASLDPEAQRTHAANLDIFRQAYRSGAALGAVLARSDPLSANMAVDPPMMPRGVYRFYNFSTRFSDGCHEEVVSVREGADKVWRVFGHAVSIQTHPCNPQLVSIN